MVQVKQSVSVRLPVRLLNATGGAVTGVVAASVTATAYNADGTSASITVTGNWNELAQGAYTLTYTPTVLGPLQVVVTATVTGGANPFVGCYDVVADFASDAVASANTAATSASGAVTAANAAQAAAVASLNVATGGWTLDPVLNQLTIYAPDNVTVIAKFNCFDASGNPSVLNVYKRVKV